MEPLALAGRASPQQFARLGAIALSLLLGVAAVGAPTTAQAAEEAAWAYELWHDTMSPYCPGRTLAECPSPQADTLRLWILTQAAAGASREEVQESLYTRFGDKIRTTPKAEGWGLAAYVIPVLAFVLFGGVVLLALRRLVGSSEGRSERAVSTAASASDEAVVGAAPNLPLRVATAAGAELSDAELERLVDDELGA